MVRLFAFLQPYINTDTLFKAYFSNFQLDRSIERFIANRDRNQLIYNILMNFRYSEK